VGASILDADIEADGTINKTLKFIGNLPFLEKDPMIQYNVWAGNAILNLAAALDAV